MSLNLLAAAALLYTAFLFGIAHLADRRAERGRGVWLSSPVVYTLSLSVYCTAWTFYGAVGYAARSGLEYLTIYLGPTLVMTGWWVLLRRLVRVGRESRITSIADLVASRFGRSAVLGAGVTVLAVVAVTPYIALQLQSVTLSLGVFAKAHGGEDPRSPAIWVAAGLAAFTILFGTRNLDANERHHGVVTAIAVEAVVKLVALTAVGGFVVWSLAGGPAPLARLIAQSPLAEVPQSGGRWIGLTMVSALAFLTLPRMFQVLVVENTDERHLATASWAFPAYLLAMSLFTVPIAVVGMELSAPGANPDLFVLSLPLDQGREGLALLAFLGGFSSATSMVIVATIALSTMVSNHIVLPLWLSGTRRRATMAGDIRRLLLRARRASIVAILGMGYLYYHVSGGGAALASIGTISFVGIIQIAPALIAGLFWRGASPLGAALGLTAGFAIWIWGLLLPSAGLISAQIMASGPFGIAALRPHALFGSSMLDPVLATALWSLTANAVLLAAGSLLTGTAAPLNEEFPAEPRSAEELLLMSQRILGAREARAFFAAEALAQGVAGSPDVTPELLERLERLMAGSVGAATAHAMVGQMAGGSGALSAEDLFAVADEAAQIMEYSARLEAKSREQERTARALRSANAKLTALGHQKDAFLSQISHELRTPMTSIRAFSDILAEPGLPSEDRNRFAGIIRTEAIRLTRLLDDLLDLSVLENGHVTLNIAHGRLDEVIDRALDAAGASAAALEVRRDRSREARVALDTDLDRLAQVFINLMTNAAKYCDAPKPRLILRAGEVDGRNVMDFIDNGSGIPADKVDLIFEKFARLGEDSKAGGAGLGLAICREVMDRLGGGVDYLPGEEGAAFRVTLPGAR